MTPISTNGYYQIEITPTMRVNAIRKALEQSVLRKSHRGLNANLIGFLGEEMALHVWQNAVSMNTFQYDIMLPYDDMNLTLEIKTKDRTVYLKPDYEASVAQITPNQRTDYYVFCSLIRTVSLIHPATTEADLIHNADLIYRGEIAGMISPSDFHAKSYLIPKNGCDRSGKKMPITPCKNIAYSEIPNFLAMANVDVAA